MGEDLGPLTLTGIALGLAMDAFAVSISLGLCGREPLGRRALRVAAHFGLFQTGMTLAGYALGWAATGLFHAASHWFPAAILWLVAGHMMLCAFGDHRPRGGAAHDPGRGLTLLALSVATSLDAFGVGMGLAFLGSVVWGASALIGVVAAALSAAGVLLACRFAKATGEIASRWAEVAGALVLVGIGVRIAMEA